MRQDNSRNKALKAFQLLRRVSEADENGNCRCIISGAFQNYKSMDGGHYISRRCRATELEPDNVWPQSKSSNRYRGESDKLAYRESLIRVIGNSRLLRIEDLESASRGGDGLSRLSDKDKRKAVLKLTSQEYDKLSKYYRAEVRRIKRDKGI